MKQVVFSVNILEDDGLHINICCEPGNKNIQTGRFGSTEAAKSYT